MIWRTLLILLCCFSLGWAQHGHGTDEHGHDHGHDHGHEHSSSPASSEEPGPAKIGDTTEVYYQMYLDEPDPLGKTPNGKRLLFSTHQGKPFKLQIGQPGIIPGFSLALVGMKPGDVKQALIPPELGYGDLRVDFDTSKDLLLNVKMVSLWTPEQMADIVEEDDHGHARANLPAVMDFMMKAFFKQSWIPNKENPDPTQRVLFKSLNVLVLAGLLILMAVLLERNRRKKLQ